MKFAVTFAVLAITGCASVADPETSAADQAAVVSTGLISVTTTCQWQVDQICYGQLNNGNNIWPSGMGITSVSVLTRSGPTRLSGRQQTYLAFVVWNDSVVGRIFRIDVGTTNATNFNTTLANTFYTQTFNLPNTTVSQGGATAGSPSPPPHPNVDGPITFDSTYLGVVTSSAAMLDRVTTDFLATKAIGID